MSYRSVIYTGTLLTGTSGLIYQVVWQRYLSFAVGSEARSVSLVVALFLAGLAAGYRFWGRRTERASGRRALLRLYGVLEIGIGLYALAFPLWLELATSLSRRAPAGLGTDLALAAATLVLPTFLMGATIPLLVSVVPERAEEVHLCHARIYGINTLGACLGAFGASFWLIPRYGLHGSLVLAAAVNLAVGLAFVLNRLRASVAKDEPVGSVPHNFHPWAVYGYSLVTGMVALSLEVLCVRVLGLTLGSAPHNFAIVVGVFILGLALGSLSVTGRMLSVRTLGRSISFLLLYLIVLYYTIPLWPLWLSNARVSLDSTPANYAVFLSIVTLFLALVLLPFLVALGTMFPLIYALIPKSATDYGKKCGWMYFANTLGTTLGAIVLSYLVLGSFDLDQVFKLDVALVALLALYVAARDGRSRRAAVLGLITAAFLVGPRWDRSSHYVGLYLFQERHSYNFDGWFAPPHLVPHVLFFDDGPDATITAVEADRGPRASGGPPVSSRYFTINGKTEGDTLLDSSTMTLAALLPYLHAPHRSGLEAAVIGLGSGVTAGLLAQGRDLGHVTVIEIAPTLIEVAPLFAEANHDLLQNPRVEVLATDGFKYFSRFEGRLDIVVSASSPPWVVGVENLFTPEFYDLAKNALRDDGVFLQWFPLFSMDDVLLRTILSNLTSSFPHVRLFRVSPSEMAIVGAKLPVLDSPATARLTEAAMSEACERLTLHDPEDLVVLELLDRDGVRGLVAAGEKRTHTLARPGLAYASDELRFVNTPIDWNRFLDRRVMRLFGLADAHAAAFSGMLARYPAGLECDVPVDGPHMVCDLYNGLQQAALGLGAPEPLVRLESYDMLRQGGVQRIDARFLEGVVDDILGLYQGDPEDAHAAVERLVAIYVKDGMTDEGARSLARLRDAGVVGTDYHDKVLADLAAARQAREAFLRLVRGN